jgi:DNA repair exonuclease SbcCD nuclease subunit
MIKGIHTGDWHLDKDSKRQKKAEEVLTQMEDYVVKNNIEFMFNGGDVFESKQHFNKNSGVDQAQRWLIRFSEKMKAVFIIKGNESHDNTGSIRMLNGLRPNIYAVESPAILAVREDGSLIKDLMDGDTEEEPYLIVEMMPYYDKQTLMGATIDENNRNFEEAFRNIMIAFGLRVKKYNCPKVMMFHGNMEGAVLSTGQTIIGQDIVIPVETLLLAGADYYALNHIHKRQPLRYNVWYSGQGYNKNYGEIEPTGMIRVDLGGEVKPEVVLFSCSRPMMTVEAEYIDGEVVLKEEVPENTEIRIKLTIKENDRVSFTAEKKEELKRLYGEDLKIDFNIIPLVKEGRSEKIMHCKTPIEELIEYGEVRGVPATESILEKARKIIEGIA